jgi:hypothetical protein
MVGYLVELLAADTSGRNAAIAAAEGELARLRSALGSAAAYGQARFAPATNPMGGTGSMVAVSDFVASIEVELAGTVNDDVLLAAIAGCADRHAGAISPARSVVLVGTMHWLRPLAAQQPDSAIRLLVAVRPTPGTSVAEFRSGWLEAGKVNARNHPTCTGYGQLHADLGRTGRVTAAAGFAGKPFAGLAIEVFGSSAGLHAGQDWALSTASIDRSPIRGEHLMDLLGRYLDFEDARTVIVTESGRDR